MKYNINDLINIMLIVIINNNQINLCKNTI